MKPGRPKIYAYSATVQRLSGGLIIVKCWEVWLNPDCVSNLISLEKHRSYACQ